MAGQEAKEKLIKIYRKKKMVRCENCGSKWGLSFHHRPKRSSQKAVHDFEHTRLLCIKCHDFFEYKDDKDQELFDKPRGYDPRNKISMAKKKKTKKAEWEKDHRCHNCMAKCASLICPHCGEFSIKIKE